MVRELKRFIEAYKYGEWVPNITQDFDFDNFIKGLNWFGTSDCPGCLKGGGIPRCDVRICCLRRKLKNCYFCVEFLDCKKLSYQKETYLIEEHYKRISKVGYKNWVKELKMKKENYDNIGYLE